MRTAPFPWRDFIRRVAVIAVPVALQNLLTTTGSMVDTMMIASLGQTEVGAVGLCAQFSSLMFSGYWGFVGGGMLFFSQYWGAKDDDGINRSYGLTLTCMMTVGLLFGLLAVLFPEAVMRLYTDKPAIQVIGVQYLRIVGFAYPLMVLSMAMAALLRCTEQVRMPLYGSIAAVATNIFLNWARWCDPTLKSASRSCATRCSSAWATWSSTWCWAVSPRRPSPRWRCSARWRAW